METPVSRRFSIDRATKACAKIEREVMLLIGLLYHCQQTEPEFHKAILKDGLERAHKLHDLARKGQGRRPFK